MGASAHAERTSASLVTLLALSLCIERYLMCKLMIACLVLFTLFSSVECQDENSDPLDLQLIQELRETRPIKAQHGAHQPKRVFQRWEHLSEKANTLNKEERAADLQVKSALHRRVAVAKKEASEAVPAAAFTEEPTKQQAVATQATVHMLRPGKLLGTKPLAPKGKTTEDLKGNASKINARVLEVWQKREKEKSRGPETQKHVLEQIRMRAEPKGTVREKYHKVQNANRNWQIKKEVAHKA